MKFGVQDLQFTLLGNLVSVHIGRCRTTIIPNLQDGKILINFSEYTGYTKLDTENKKSFLLKSTRAGSNSFLMMHT